MENDNLYLNQVIAQKAQLESDLKAQPPQARHRRNEPQSSAQDEWVSPYANNVRITGWWPFQNVIVPPNVYVVHTRKGYKEPLNIGLGLSFRFDSVNDSYLIVPATMQTILIHANCICKEMQGLVVQGYVQWIIDDIKTAYRKLDFSDGYDPMRIVNVQLREQAEAAIKDKVATMSIDEVLTDKHPIIEELTARLRNVSEGAGSDKGLGLRIVTVQIKEAVVCSSQVWEMLQRPFRSERSKEARLAELVNEAVINQKEAEAQKNNSRLKIETEQEIARLQANADAEKFDRDQTELIRRAALEEETLQQTMEHQKAMIEHEAEIERLKLERTLVRQQMEQEMQNNQTVKEIEFEGARQKIENEISSVAIEKYLIDRLPEIAEKLPKPSEVKAFSLGNDFSLLKFIEGIKDIFVMKNRGEYFVSSGHQSER